MDLNRRAFVAAAAASPILLGAGSAFARLSRGPVLKIAVIGCGGRGTGAMFNALAASKESGCTIEVVALADLFEERTTTNEAGETTVQKACVRLTGKAGFYERRRLRLSWPAWCERQGLSYTANPAEVKPKPRAAPGAPRKAPRPNTLTLPEDRDAAVAILMAKLSEFGVDLRVASAEEATEIQAEGEVEEGEAEAEAAE